ncbi:DUF5606 family protein [Imtechella halotolerans]|uniref:Uncharacterized protein n=1 Tax=Imtechella halotolerans K1 TaxID=946077 RepID=I0WFD5_9FLAO|nr:DUF5606 domain-containing protein [Imtechella halotolerans]EID75101.1 hypothetical protein W5A_07192 [Imtechella halotolerans K1]WMQ62175.1 DUF5606 domain-containing protein [Imtechella halotolerans]
MSLEKILSISGKPGLYELHTQTRTGFVAVSLLDGKRITVGLRSNVSLLSEIAIYTLQEEVPLREVFKAIKTKENGGKTSVSPKDSKEALEEYFFEVLPNYDEDRVYASDIKKVLQWYNLLQENGKLNNEESEATEVSTEEEQQA